MSVVYNGVTITGAIYNSINLLTIIYNGTTVFTAGNQTGLFYGGYTGSYLATTTRFNTTGTMIGSETAIDVARSNISGASLQSLYGGYYGGLNGSTMYNRLTRISNVATLVGATTLGTVRYSSCGCDIDIYGMFYGGYVSGQGVKNICTRMDVNGNIYGSETSVGTSRFGMGSANLNNTAIYYAGYNLLNKVTKINVSGAMVGTETSVGTGRHGLGGAQTNNHTVGVYFGGGGPSAVCTRLDSNGSIIGSETSLSPGKNQPASAAVGSNAMFYGGADSYNNVVKIINASGAMVGSETSGGTARSNFGGAGL